MTSDFARLFEQANGVDKLMTLQGNANDDIRQRAVGILQGYFGLEDDSDSDPFDSD